MIYFIESGAGGPIKIGVVNFRFDVARFEESVQNRLKALQSCNPETLRVLALCSGHFEEEKVLLSRFVSGCIRHEWFRRDTPGLMEMIQQVSRHQLCVICEQRLARNRDKVSCEPCQSLTQASRKDLVENNYLTVTFGNGPKANGLN